MQAHPAPHSRTFVCRASDKCLKEKRKTINGDDLLCAMSTLGFEDYIEPLKLYLQKFREVCHNAEPTGACSAQSCMHSLTPYCAVIVCRLR